MASIPVQRPRVLIVSSDRPLAEVFAEATIEAGAEPLVLASARLLASLHGRARPAAVAILVVGMATACTLQRAADLLSLPALRSTTALLATTTPERSLPPLPGRGRAAEVRYLLLPFELDAFEAVICSAVAVASPIPQPGPRGPVLHAASRAAALGHSPTCRHRGAIVREMEEV